MTISIAVYTIGGDDLLFSVFNAVAALFNDESSHHTIRNLATVIGGILAVIEFTRSKDIAALMKWVAMYIIITSLVLVPKVTIDIIDSSGIRNKALAVDNVPLALGIIAGLSSQIGVGFTQKMDAVFHTPDDLSYSKTGMLMGSRLFLASRNFEITDSNLTETLDEFMQQCVFYDILLNKYSIDDLINAPDAWDFIKNKTSAARAFPLNNTIVSCKDGVGGLEGKLTAAVESAKAVYGSQLFMGSNDPKAMLISHLQSGYTALTSASVTGDKLLQTNLLANSISHATSRFGASINAPAALQVYMDTKTELQSRETMDLSGRQAGIWMEYFKNVVTAVLYGSFVLVYFMSYLPFGVSIIKNYISGLFIVQFLDPMYAIVNFAASTLAETKSTQILGHDTGSSISTLAGVTQANADAVAVAGYLIWPVTIGGIIMLYRGLPSAIQSMGQYMGGVIQNSGSHVVSEAVGGNISAGNTNFGNHSLNNTNANHFDTNARFSAGGATFQTGNGSMMSIMPSGGEVLNTQGALSNMSVSVRMAESMRMAATQQSQQSLNSALSLSHSAGEQYATGLRSITDYSDQNSHTSSSGKSYSESNSAGFSHSANDTSNIVETFRKEHHISHERALQLFGQVYADSKSPIGGSANLSLSGRSAFGSLYNDAVQYSKDNNFVQSVDNAKRDITEQSYRDGSDNSKRFSDSVSQSFDTGDNYRKDASSQYSQSIGYSSLASTTSENASSIDSNYTQEFYEWMRHQPSPSAQYGQGTWSKSAIGDLAVHDTSKLQSYADRFVSEKTHEAISEYQQKNHFNDANSYVSSNDRNNSKRVDSGEIIGLSENLSNMSSHNVQNMNAFNSHSSHPSDYGVVDSSVKSTVENNLSKNKHDLDAREVTNEAKGEHEKNEITKKVKGQVFGSLVEDEKEHIVKNIKNTIKEIYHD